MTRRLRTLAPALAALALAVGLSACAPAADPVAVTAETVVLDVRTASEYAGGHLGGAQLLDQSAGAVAAAIPELDPEASYLVYCRSGNRAGQAVALMQQAGFTDVTNLGSLEQAASATGLQIVAP